MTKTITTILTIGSLIGMLFAVDAMYLHRKDFEAFAQGEAAYKSEVKVEAIQRQQWSLDDRIDALKDDGEGQNTKAIRALEERKKELASQLELEKAKLKSIYDKK